MQAKFAFAALFQVILAGLASAQFEDCSRTYVVKANDYCDKISADENTSTYQLAQANIGRIDSQCTNLWVGETICLGLTGSDCLDNYVVKLNDNCTAIASDFSITSSAILLNNPNVNSDCSNIYPGLVLCVAPVTPSRK